MKTIKEIKGIIKDVLSEVHSISHYVSKDENVKVFQVVYGGMLDQVKIWIINNHVHSVNGSISVYEINRINDLIIA